MRWEHIKKETVSTSQWEGGTTTELYIFPKGAFFKEKNFDFRLSTATVTVEEASFTHLPGVYRKLMVLEGKLLLVHEGHYSKVLNPFEQDKFDGGWLTKSYGKATDFNLMTTGKTQGELAVITLLTNEQQYRLLTNNVEIFYVYKGGFEFNNLIINSGEVLSIYPDDKQTIQYLLKGKEHTVLLHVSISLQQ